MDQALTTQQVAERLVQIEHEMDRLRQEVAALRRQTPTTSIALAYAWADKNLQRRYVNDLFASLAIRGQALGALALQQNMSRANMVANELSQSLVSAREA